MPSRLYTLCVDARDPESQARFWGAVLDYPVGHDEGDDEEWWVQKDDDTFPAILFLKVPESKSVKNRLHIDLAPDDRDNEVERVMALGATRADVGQTGDESWVVLADPEGNEFCVLSARKGGV
jgi:predicted enzyme related to lactoylglutathione lyase